MVAAACWPALAGAGASSLEKPVCSAGLLGVPTVHFSFLFGLRGLSKRLNGLVAGVCGREEGGGKGVQR